MTILKDQTEDAPPNRVLQQATNTTGSAWIEPTYDATGTLEDTFDFYYTAGWQCVEEVQTPETGTASVVSQFVWGLRYIDDLVCRDRTVSSTTTRHYALGDRRFNVVAIVPSAGGAVDERYSYTPYGTVTFLSASWAVQSASSHDWVYLFQGLRRDQESGLIENRNRVLNPLLGRFMQRDPLGYPDGMNAYAAYHLTQWAADPLGLARRENIEENRVLYTCNCGWIDFGHGHGLARQVFRNMRNAAQEALRSYSRAGYKVVINWTLGRVFHGSAEYHVYKDKLDSDNVALSIFRDASVKNEQWQRSGGNHAAVPRARNSSFSEEDLPSNLTSFYAIKDGLSRADIEKVCGVVSRANSLKIWDEGGHTNTGSGESTTPWTSQTYWQPVYKTGKSQTARTCCENMPKEWPQELRSVQDEQKAFDAWSEGVYYDIYFDRDYYGPDIAPRGTDQIRDRRNLPGNL